MQNHTLVSIIYKTSDPLGQKQLLKKYIYKLSESGFLAEPWCEPVVHPDRISGCPLFGFPELFFAEFFPTPHMSQRAAEFLFSRKKLNFFPLLLFSSVFLVPTIFFHWLISLNFFTIKKLRKLTIKKKIQLGDQFKCKKLVPALNCQSEIAFGPVLSSVFLPGLPVAARISALGKGGSISTHHQKDLEHYLDCACVNMYIKV